MCECMEAEERGVCQNRIPPKSALPPTFNLAEHSGTFPDNEYSLGISGNC